MRFGAGWLSAGVAALLLTAGCKEGKPIGGQAPVAQQAEQSQEQSEKALEQARKVQEKATGEQRDAVQAQRDVEKAQKDLAEAQAKARTEAQQAQTAQQQAQQQTQQAQQTAEQAQASALESQRQQQGELAQQNPPQEELGPQPEQETEQSTQGSQLEQQPVAEAPSTSTPAQGEQFIAGEVLTANASEVLVSTRGEPQIRLQVQPGTQIIVDGRMARATDITEGSQVRASYHDQGGEPTATRIEVTTAQQPPAPTAPESGESSPGDQEPPFQE